MANGLVVADTGISVGGRAVLGANLARTQIGMITHTSDTALATQASGGSQIGSAVSMVIPAAGVIRIVPLVFELDETEGGAGSAGIGVKVGSDAVKWAKYCASGNATLKFVDAFYGAASTAGILQPIGSAMGEGQGHPNGHDYNFDIVYHSCSTGTQDIEVWLGDNVNSIGGELTITGSTVTTRFLVEVIDGT